MRSVGSLAVALWFANGMLAACGDPTTVAVDAATTDGAAPDLGVGSPDLAVPCAMPRRVCGDTCADLTTSHDHCGGCGAACPAEATCVKSQCQCPIALCDSACVDTNSDVKHCGSCLSSCAADQICDGGFCKADNEWAGWPMPTPPASHLRNPASLDTPLPGIVVDNVTGLNWERVPAPGTYSVLDGQKYCANLTLVGGSWRLPSVIELLSIVDESRFDPAIDSAAFQGTPFGNGEGFWTSSPEVAMPGNRWLVSFDDGMPSTQPGTGQKRVRCVR